MEKAFETALKGAATGEVNGKLSLHELRDTFRTQASRQQCDNYVAEFALGHEIDKLGYNKVYYDEAFVWENLKKIYGPVPEQIEEVAARNKDLAQKVAALKKDLNELSEHYQNQQKILEDSLAFSRRILDYLHLADDTWKGIEEKS